MVDMQKFKIYAYIASAHVENHCVTYNLEHNWLQNNINSYNTYKEITFYHHLQIGKVLLKMIHSL